MPTPIEYMEGTYQLLIRKSYDDISDDFVSWISNNARGYLFVEHEADEDVKSTHCHLSFTDMSVSVKALDKQRKKAGLDGAASRLLSCPVGEKHQRYDEYKLNIYCLKGDVEKCKKTNYLDAAIEAWAAQWVPKADLPSVSRGAPREAKPVYDEYEVIKKDFIKYFEDMNKPSITLDGMRTWTMRWYWKRDGRMPPATAYKRNAASLYVLAVEMSHGCIETAFEELKQLWY